MHWKIFSLVLLCLIPFVYAEDFSLPGCNGPVDLGINSYYIEELNLETTDCYTITDRTYFCNCNDGIISLYSDSTEEYDLVFEYEDNGVMKIKRFDNIIFKEQYVNENLNYIVTVFLFCIVGGITLPLIFIWISSIKNGKN